MLEFGTFAQKYICARDLSLRLEKIQKKKKKI